MPDMFKQKKVVENGIIKYIDGGRATVEVIQPNLQECKSCSGCMETENKRNFFEVDVLPGLHVGQRVTFQIITHSPYKGMLLIFILPLISLVVGSLIGQKFRFLYPNSQDVRMICCGFMFFILSILAVSIYEKMTRNKKQIHREIISIDTQNDATLTPG